MKLIHYSFDVVTCSKNGSTIETLTTFSFVANSEEEAIKYADSAYETWVERCPITYPEPYERTDLKITKEYN